MICSRCSSCSRCSWCEQDEQYEQYEHLNALKYCFSIYCKIVQNMNTRHRERYERFKL